MTALTTSAYPGQCTNLGSGADADFTLGPPTTLQTSSTTSVVGYELKLSLPEERWLQVNGAAIFNGGGHRHGAIRSDR